MTEKIYLTPQEASNFLNENYFACSLKTLAKFRCVGGGAKFSKVGNKRIIYNVSDLREWAENRISKPYENTTQAQASLGAI